MLSSWEAYKCHIVLLGCSYDRLSKVAGHVVTDQDNSLIESMNEWQESCVEPVMDCDTLLTNISSRHYSSLISITSHTLEAAIT